LQARHGPYSLHMPEGDTLHRAARRLQVLVGDAVEARAVHPRAAAVGVAEQIDGRRLEAVDAHGKNLLLRFEGGLVLRSHLRMSGRWRVQPRGAPISGRPWLVLHGTSHSAVLSGGPVLELSQRAIRALGPDILADPPDLGRMVQNLREVDPTRELGDALLDQRVVAGIGTVWRSEALWRARLSPWLPLADVADEELLEALRQAARLMRASLEGAREQRTIYRRSGRSCPRCGAAIRSRGQGDDNRTAFWCPGCQRGPQPAAS
jgi:endonuclease VIII